MRRFPSASRLTRKADLELVRQEGKRFRTESLEVRYLASLLPHPRIGIIVPKHKHTAVARNRVKRRLRELARATLLPSLAIRQPVDVVLRATPVAYDAPFARLSADVARIAGRLEDRVAARDADRAAVAS